MTIPILIDGKRQGTLETRRAGAYTLFEARCAFVPGVRRLRVFGEGGCGCLGVMQPAGSELRLRRKLSRADMHGFPEKIEYAGFAEEQGPAAPPKRRDAPLRGEEKAFVFTDRGVRYLALPCAMRTEREGLRLREIGGRTYLLFRC